MIFYTIQGPKFKLEIHDDKLRLVKKGFFALFSKTKGSSLFPTKRNYPLRSNVIKVHPVGKIRIHDI